ncbi:MAG: hypothetical protein KGM92_10775, partial [Acidobacteriota bacterium]|nr:hypothetical protein [Acidobacteriota bacterium]
MVLPARRGTDPERDEKFESGFLQQRVGNEPVPWLAAADPSSHESIGCIGYFSLGKSKAGALV